MTETPSGWQRTILGALAKSGHGFVDGPFGSNLPASEYVPAGVPVIRGSNLSLGVCRFSDKEFVFVSDETARRLERSLCGPNDIVFTKKGTLGQVGFIPTKHRFDRFLLSSNQMKLSVNPEKADPLFVYYYVSSPASRVKIIRDSEATGVPKINLAYLRKFPINLPPPGEQRAVARMLGAIDDKIDLNHRTNETLESIARAIFKSWFVDFDPVRAKANGRQPAGMETETAALFPASMTRGESETPTGWKCGKVGDIASSTANPVDPRTLDAETPYIGLEHMPRRRVFLDEWGQAGQVMSGKARFRTTDVLFGKLRPYFHKVGIAPVPGVCSTDVLAVTPESDIWLPFVLMHLSSDNLIEHANACSSGTKMPRVRWGDLARFEIAIPPERLASTYSRLVSPMLIKATSNVLESRTLAQLRDVLLPKLLSGELRIRDAEKLVGVHT